MCYGYYCKIILIIQGSNDHETEPVRKIWLSLRIMVLPLAVRNYELLCTHEKGELCEDILRKWC